jgi:F-box domain
MPLKIISLPPETLEDIISHLPLSTVRLLRSVCRTLSFASTRKAFRTVTIHASNEELQRFKTILEKDGRSRFVKELVVDAEQIDSRNPGIQTELTSIFTESLEVAKLCRSFIFRVSAHDKLGLTAALSALSDVPSKQGLKLHIRDIKSEDLSGFKPYQNLLQYVQLLDLSVDTIFVQRHRTNLEGLEEFIHLLTNLDVMILSVTSFRPGERRIPMAVLNSIESKLGELHLSGFTTGSRDLGKALAGFTNSLKVLTLKDMKLDDLDTFIQHIDQHFKLDLVRFERIRGCNFGEFSGFESSGNHLRGLALEVQNMAARRGSGYSGQDLELQDGFIRHILDSG